MISGPHFPEDPDAQSWRHFSFCVGTTSQKDGLEEQLIRKRESGHVLQKKIIIKVNGGERTAVTS